MRQENMRSHYLKMMDITEWRLKASQPVLSGYYYELTSDLPQKNYLLADLDSQNEAQEQTLLSNITKALNFQMKGGSFALNNLVLQFDTTARIIVMGKNVHEWVKKNLNSELKKGIQKLSTQIILVTYSPAELLASPSLKAEVWRDLQQIFPRN